MKPPAFQFYADDFLAGTIDMSPEEVGAYIRLLCHQWARGEIAISDPAKLARIAGTAVSADVLAKFPDGKNQRLEAERIKQDEYREAKSQSGRIGATKRWHSHSTPNGTPIVSPLANGMAKNGSPSPSPSPSPSVVSSLHKRKAASPQPTDEVWLESLKLDPAYACIDVAREFAKSARWCAENNRKITRRFFINWLNRIDKPINGERKLEHGDAF